MFFKSLGRRMLGRARIGGELPSSLPETVLKQQVEVARNISTDMAGNGPKACLATFPVNPLFCCSRVTVPQFP